MAEIHQLVFDEGLFAVEQQAASKIERRVARVAARSLTNEPSDPAYTHPGLCLCVLPHKPVAAGEVWRRSNGTASLAVHPIQTEDGTYKGVPYGPKARLILLWLQSEALRTNSRFVELGSSMRPVAPLDGCFLLWIELPIGPRASPADRAQPACFQLCDTGWRQYEMAGLRRPGQLQPSRWRSCCRTFRGLLRCLERTPRAAERKRHQGPLRQLRGTGRVSMACLPSPCARKTCQDQLGAAPRPVRGRYCPSETFQGPLQA